MTHLKKYTIGAMLLLTVFWGTALRSEILGDYVGYTACADCHPDIVEGWKTTAHARAFNDLKTQGEEKQTNPGCFRCHVVGYGEDGGYIDMELTPELKDVQCEACHGPGKTHTETIDPAALSRAGEDVCRKCHTEGQDKDFDFVKKSKKIHGEQ